MAITVLVNDDGDDDDDDDDDSVRKMQTIL